MSRQFVAAACAAVGFVGIAGCGASASKSLDTTSAEGLCPAVRTAYGRYAAATSAMGLQLENIVLLVASKKAAEAFLRRTEQLERVTSGAQKRELASLQRALSDQLKTFEAFENHNLTEVAKYGNSINARLRQGLIDLGTICPPPK
jgi:hypothetical protein